MLRPPTWVNGPYVPPATPPPVPRQRQPQARWWIVRQGETLRGLAERMYGNHREAVRIYNANRGTLSTMDDFIPAGTTLLIP